jgi:protoheme IX farnesyltransferase
MARLAKPGIVAALLLTCYTGMVLAERGLPDSRLCLVCLGSLFLSASGSAMLNGLLDARIDVRMMRLRKRVAALNIAGQGPVTAIALAGTGAGLLIALIALGTLPFLLVLAAVVSYTLYYTLRLKRRSPWGAIPGGIPGALPVLIGYTAAAHTVRLDGFILFAVMLLWQPPHFWTLALEYRLESAAAGLPVLPAVRGQTYTILLFFVYATALLPTTLALWLFGFCSAWYAGIALLGWFAFFVASCGYLLRSHRYLPAFGASICYLVVVLLAIIGDICFIGGTLP